MIIVDKKNYIVAIDIGSSAIKIAVGSIAPSGAMHIECIVSEPCQEMEAGLVNNINLVGVALRKALKAAEKLASIAITDAYVSVSGKFMRCARYTDHVFVTDSDNCISQQDVRSLHDRMRNVKATDNEIIMDLFPICYKSEMGVEMKNPVGSYSKQLNATYNFILCEKQAKDRCQRLVLDAGGQIHEMFAGASIISESVVTAEEKEEGVAVVDIGSGVTDLAIYRGGALCYMVSIPIGGDSINSDIHHYSGQIPLSSIEGLKKEYGSAMVSLASNVTINIQKGTRTIATIQSLNLAAIIEARLTDIVEYVWNEIREANYAKKIPAGIVLTGGVANVKNIAELFQRITGVETRVACAELGLTTESLEEATSPERTMVVSLLMRGAQKGATPVGILQTPQEEMPSKEVTPAKVEVTKPQEQAPEQPKTLNDKLGSKENNAKVENTTPLNNGDDGEEDDDIDVEETVAPKRSLWGRLTHRLKSSFDKAFQNPDEDYDDDNDEY